jgi:hypothetical protein
VGNFNQTGGQNNPMAEMYLGDSPTGHGTYTLSAGTLALTNPVQAPVTEFVGYQGTGTFNQTGGAHTIGSGGSSGTGTLSVGSLSGSTGMYTLSGGSLTVGTLVNSSNGFEMIGDGGMGTFNQTGGTNTIVGNGSGSIFSGLYVGNASGSTGAYSLSGTGSLNVQGIEYVGNDGSGTFIQSGGANSTNITGDLFLGNNPDGGGSYSLGSGTLSVAGVLNIGHQGVGSFNQTGGQNNAGASMSLGVKPTGQGTYTMSGGTLVVTNSTGTSDFEFVGVQGIGTFNQSGGAHTISSGGSTGSGTLSIGRGFGSTGAYTLSGGSLTVGTLGFSDGFEMVGDGGTGTFNQTGGTNTINNDQFGPNSGLYVGYVSGSTGAYSLSGTGSLNVTNWEYIGYSGNGTFSQTGGTNANRVVEIGNNSGSAGGYTLSGGLLTVSQVEVVGASGSGTFTHTGGTSQVGYEISIADAPDSTGTYNLSGTGSLVTSAEYVGFNGTANFNQTGGFNTVTFQPGSPFTSAMYLGYEPGANAHYTISGGTAHIYGSVYVGGGDNGAPGGTGVLTVSGTGAFNLENALVVFNTPGSSVNLNGGTISTLGLNVNGNPSLFNWTSGTLNLISDVVFDSAASPTSTGAAFGSSLTLNNNQTLIVGGIETLGGAGPFSLTLNSGSTHSVGVFISLSPTGTLTLNVGSTLHAQVNQIGGTLNGDLLNQSQFIYGSGQFNGRLLNQGAVLINANQLVLANGVENDATFTVYEGQTLTSNGQGLDNLGQFILQGGTLSGNGPAINDYGGTMQAHGSINSAFTNDGRLIIDGTLRLNGGASNFGIIQGDGSVLGNVLNGVGGIIQPANLSNNSSGGGNQDPLAFTSFQGNSAGALIQVGAGLQLNISNAWSNAGLVTLGGSTAGNSALLGGGGTITNTGTIQGAGIVASPVTNSTGVIRASGGELDLAGAGSSNAASARIEAATGNTVVFLQGLAANAGTIALTGGVFDNNNHTLLNAGIINGRGEVRTSGLTVANTGSINVGSGDLSVLGNLTNNGTVSIQFGRSAYFYGNVNGAGGYTGTGTAVYLAGFSPGNSPATVGFQGDVMLGDTASLTIELGGTTTGTQYDHVNIGGKLSLGGTLSVSLINSFMPSRLNKFDVLDWGTRSGTFSTLQLPALTGTLGWNATNLYTTGTLSVVDLNLLPGDMNLDGQITAADLPLLELALTNRAGYESTVGVNDAMLNIVGDADESGTFDNADLQGLIYELIHGTSFLVGNPRPLGESDLRDNSTAAVPEPASWLLLAIGGLVVASKLRRNRRPRPASAVEDIVAVANSAL